MRFFNLYKRIIDVTGSVCALFALSPLLLGVSVVIFTSDKGPVFFKQKRVGRAGTVFGIYKFRSMIVNAEKIGGYSTQDADPRITPVGRWIRKTSIDELPQLINVLAGDMSLVGPRPDVPAQKALYTEQEWQRRTSVKPGITGLAQATLRSQATAEQRKALDLQYVRDISLLTDLKIIFMTIRQVVMKGGN